MRHLYIIPLVLLITSCGSDHEEAAPFEEEVVQSDTVFVDNFFPPFNSDEIPVILEKLGLCTTIDSLAGKPKSICSDKLFRVFPLGPEISYDEGFIVDTKIGVLSSSSTTKAFLVFYNVNGQLKMVNFLKGKVLEFRTTASGYYNVVMQYRDTRVGGNISVLHKWNPGNTAYLPVNVSEINNHFIKQTYQDSINHVYLDEFAWGY